MDETISEILGKYRYFKYTVWLIAHADIFYCFIKLFFVKNTQNNSRFDTYL